MLQVSSSSDYRMSYLGSKAASGVFQAIISSMPPHDTYIETHLGGGAVMARKPASIRSIGIDLDASALNQFSKNHPDLNAILHQGDAVAFLDEFDFKPAGRTLIYADPPYLHSTRSSKNRYKHEYDIEDHKRLIDVLKRLAAAGIVNCS